MFAELKGFMLYLEAFTCQNRYQRTLLVSDLLSFLVMCRLNNNLHSASLQLTPNWGDESSCFRAGLSLRGTWTAGGMGYQEPYEVLQLGWDSSLQQLCTKGLKDADEQ